MKLQAVYQIEGLSKVVSGSRKAEGIALAGDEYEVDEATGKKHLAEGYAVLPGEVSTNGPKSFGPAIIEAKAEQSGAPTMADIAPPVEPAKAKGKGKGKAPAAPVVPVESTDEASDDLGLGLDDGSDAVE